MNTRPETALLSKRESGITGWLEYPPTGVTPANEPPATKSPSEPIERLEIGAFERCPLATKLGSRFPSESNRSIKVVIVAGGGIPPGLLAAPWRTWVTPTSGLAVESTARADTIAAEKFVMPLAG